MGPEQVLLLEVRVDLGVIAMKRYSTFPKPLGLTMRWFSVISRTLVSRVMGLTPLQRCNWWIVQPQCFELTEKKELGLFYFIKWYVLIQLYQIVTGPISFQIWNKNNSINNNYKTKEKYKILKQSFKICIDYCEWIFRGKWNWQGKFKYRQRVFVLILH